MQDVQLTIAAEKGAQALSLMQMRGYEIPKPLTDAIACQRELEKVMAAPPQMPGIPNEPKKVRESLQAIAAAARTHLDMQQAGEQVRPQLTSMVVGATRSAIPAWITNLQTDFADSWAAFRKAWPAAPTSLNAYSTDEDAAAHAQLLRSAGQLDIILGARVSLGTLVGEDGADQRNVLLVAALPTPPADPSTVADQWQPLGTLIDTWMGGHVRLTTGTRPPAAGLVKWDAIAQADTITVSLAGIDDLEQRHLKRDAWTQAMSRHNQRGAVPYPNDHTFATV